MAIVKIETESMKRYGFSGIKYWLIFEDSKRPIGEAELIFEKVGDENISEGLNRLLLERGLKPGTVVAYINSFYPHGYGKSEEDIPVEFMRQGVGSMLLERIVKDALKRNAKVSYTETYNNSMQKFCLKKGFEPRGERNEQYFKFL